MANQTSCVFCTDQANVEAPIGDGLRIRCPRCGEYILTGTAETLLRDRPLPIRGAVSGWIRRQNSMGVTPKIDNDAVNYLRALEKPRFNERVEQYLLAASVISPRLDRLYNPVTPALVGVSYSEDPNDLGIILQYLQDEGFLTNELDPGGARRVTPKGHIAADELRSRRAASSQAFVAMSFSDEMKAAYDNGIEPGIRNAGFSSMLIRNKEHANKIDDEIIAEIRRSAFLVADFTNHRQNVYFETGFAIGLGLQVIWTCRKDHVSELHFDIRQYNCIDWQDNAELARRLQRRIEASFGRGPLVAH